MQNIKSTLNYRKIYQMTFETLSEKILIPAKFVQVWLFTVY